MVETLTDTPDIADLVEGLQRALSKLFTILCRDDSSKFVPVT